MLFIRSLFLNIAVYGIIAAGCILNSFLGLFSREFIIWFWNHTFIPALVLSLKYIGGIQIEIRGAQYLNQTGGIYAGKHESAVETYVLSNYLKRATFVMKKELTYIPLFGWAQYFYGMIPINRSAGSKAMKDMLTAARNRINLGRPIIIFPEGTRKAPREEPNYKPGVALLYNHLNVPVIPFATNTAYFWKKSSFLRFPGKVIFEFMEPMPTGMDKNEFMTELQNRIETKCKELNDETEKNYPFNALTHDTAQKN